MKQRFSGTKRSFTNKEDAEVQDVLMCIQMKKLLDDPNRMKFSTDEFYFKTYDEMLAVLPYYEEALKNDHPDVAIVVRDSMAVSFINVARLQHIHIPDEMQVIGFQNTKYAELSRPKLSCIETPIYDLGEKAMDLLTKLMDIYEADDDEEIEEAILSGDIEKARVVAEEHVAHLKEFVIKHGENLFQDTKKDEIN